MIFSKMARQFLLRVSRIPLLATAVAAVALSAPLNLGAQEKNKGLSEHGAGSDEAAQNPFEVAQGYGRPPGDIGEPGDVPYGGEPSDGGQLLVRIGRLESQIREINGQIEQMQFETHKLEEQLRKFEEDVDFRFREGSPGAPAAKPPQKHSESTETPTPAPAEAQLASPGVAAPAPRAGGRGDAFDPSQNPTAPGAPRPLGSRAAAAVSNPGSARRDESASPGLDQNDPGAPLDLSNGRSRTPAATPPLAMAPPAGPASGTVIATAPKSAREEFDIALAFLKQRSYEDAEKGFTSFLQKNPKNKLASDAIYFLGESFYRRGRQREAAEQFLKLSTQYADSPRAPEALLRLGQSLNALGAKEQACATYGEITRKYPDAPAMVKVGAEREVKRAQC